MFLHSGASLHGHEYSNKTATGGPQPARSRMLLRSSLGASPLQRSSFSTDETETPTQRINRRLSLQEPGAATRPVRRTRPVSDFVSRRDLVVRFEEEPTVVGDETHGLDGVSEDEGSLVSEISDTSTVKRSKRSRRAARQCTSYLLAYPPPKLRTKQRRFVSIRPRLLLQLQQLSNEKRPMPAIDVVPSSMIAGTVILPRLARRFPKMFRVKGQLGMNGLILARSEDYDNDADDSDSNDKDLDKRDLVAVISPVSSRKEGERRDSSEETEIVLADGSVWTATQTSNGSYDFVHMDEAGQTRIARWARRSTRPLSTATCTTVSNPAPSEYKFTFSILDPQLRRHPVMATLTPANLEILDNYTTVSQSSGRYPMRPFSTDLSGDKGVSSPPATTSLPVAQREIHPVDEATRTLITVTSVWVSLRHGQGWASSAASPVPGTYRPVQSRTVSGSSSQSRASTFPVSTTEMSRISSPPLVQQQFVTQPAPNTPKRTVSSGAAFMQRRQTKLGGESLTADNAAENEDLSGLENVPEPVPLKRSFSKRIRDWGHRFTSRKTATV
ncbi:hypothetical protein CORC01_13650 [Colletotrichum orchidophilum]|uniref:Uncharacterized protein n=1 Tax=Colletotrichum orchidophilum TaxID=1209926 RepID=A0A1G4APW3_9PEZI|nr:uncharacterized protein CORC01_13650 [Colletotrichum orchidophilum]OHE91062.1 hypothetical protein CORC01_13650 [Colletotrichum orchidophilum]